MSEPQDPQGPGDVPPSTSGESPDDHLEVGSVGEEAVKLFGALADLARQHGAEAGSGLGGLAGQAASLAQHVDEHVATGSAECRYCPVCRVVHVVRTTSPEVRTHLLTAASSLVQAAAGLLATVPPPGTGGEARRGSDVEHIDLDGSDEFDDLGTEEEDGSP